MSFKSFKTSFYKYFFYKPSCLMLSFNRKITSDRFGRSNKFEVLVLPTDGK